MRTVYLLLTLSAALLAVPVAAQLALPGVGVPQVPAVGVPELPLGRTLDDVTGTVGRTAKRLLDLRAERIDRLLRRNRDIIELDAQGAPARRGELLLLDPTPSTLAAAGRSAGGPEGPPLRVRGEARTWPSAISFWICDRERSGRTETRKRSSRDPSNSGGMSKEMSSSVR